MSGLERRRLKVDVVDWVERYGSTSSTSESKDGHAEVVVRCGECDKDKLWINAKTGAWICYRCGRQGDFARYVAEATCISTEAAERLVYADEWESPPPREVDDTFLSCRNLAEAIEMSWIVDREKAAKGPPPPPTPEPLPGGFEPCVDRRTRATAMPRYLRDRGITFETAERYGLGFTMVGRYANRIVMPVTDRGRYMGFTTRACFPHVKPKYLTCSTMDKKACMYGLDQVFLARRVIVCEGPFDCLWLAQNGLPAVALQGKSFQREHLKMLHDGGTEELVVMFDSDDPGAYLAAQKAVNRLRWCTVGGKMLDIKVAARLPEGLDPATSTKEQIVEAVEGATYVNDFTVLEAAFAYRDVVGWARQERADPEQRITFGQPGWPWS